jgi:FkbM family methyltransferase
MEQTVGLVDRARRYLRRRMMPDSEKATVDDVYYCYRLFLNRAPDAEGLRFWMQLVNEQRVTVAFLTDSFLNSDEFRALQAARNTPELVDLEGFKLYVVPRDFFIGAAIARDRVYERHVTRYLKGLLEPGMVFLDLGANIGYFTMMAAVMVGPQGQVLAFEPAPANCDLIRKSVAENGVDNVRLFPVAVSDRAGEVAIDAGAGQSNSRIMELSAATEGRQIVRTVRIDDTLDDLERLDVVKIDIEGAEPLALRGMKDLLAAFRPVIVLELSPDLIEVTSKEAPEPMLAALQALDYDLFILPVGGDGSPQGPLSAEQILEQCQGLPYLGHVDLVALPR